MDDAYDYFARQRRGRYVPPPHLRRRHPPPRGYDVSPSAPQYAPAREAEHPKVAPSSPSMADLKAQLADMQTRLDAMQARTAALCQAPNGDLPNNTRPRASCPDKQASEQGDIGEGLTAATDNTDREQSTGCCNNSAETARKQRDAKIRAIVNMKPHQSGYYDRTRCGAHSRSTGKPCTAKGLLPSGRCRNHGGASTGPKTAEGKARIVEAQRRRWANCAPNTHARDGMGL